MTNKTKKTLKIAIVNFWDGFNFPESITFSILNKYFYVVLDQNNPDFVISSVFGNIKNVLRYDCPRIQYIGEPRSTDYSLFDYSIDFDFMIMLDRDWNDRHFRLPVGFCEWHNKLAQAINTPPSREEAELIYRGKSKFCSFIYGHESNLGMRENLFRTIASYKRVDSAGRYMNNMPDGRIVTYSEDKLAFMADYKFTIAAESCSFPGFVTEKIVHAFYAHTIPIYFGDPLVTKTFNKDAFINSSDYPSERELLERVAEVDNNKDLYLHMLQAPKFSDEYEYNLIMQKYENFLLHIFSQEPTKAIRRQTFYSAKIWENELKQRFAQPIQKPGLFYRGRRFLRNHFARTKGK